MVPFQHSWDVRGSTWAWNVTGYEGGCFVHSSSQVTKARRITNLQSLWKESGFSTNAIVCKLPDLFFGDDRCIWWFLNKLTGKYPFYHWSAYQTEKCQGQFVSFYLFIMYSMNDSKTVRDFTIVIYLCKKKTHCLCWVAYARWALLAAYSLSSQITVNVSFSLLLSVWKLSFTVHLSDSSILYKQPVRWLNHLRYLRALRISQAIMNML